MIPEYNKGNFTSKAIVKDLVLDCFLHHRLKLIRNWGSTDDTDELSFKDATLLQFATKTVNFQIVIRPDSGEIMIMHTTKRGRALYIYFFRKITSMMESTHTPNFVIERGI